MNIFSYLKKLKQTTRKAIIIPVTVSQTIPESNPARKARKPRTPIKEIKSI